ncbi:MAG: hypothetical protein HQK76_02645 [Desulfobacterales bacterium]|nr:hypothetical protein [Desulfobacterales bacterium]
MNETTTKYLEAHVEYELDRFKNGGYRQTIEEEVSAAFGWSKKVTLNDVVTPEQIIGVIQRNVVERPIEKNLTSLIIDMSKKVLSSQQNQTTLFSDIFERKQFDAFVNKGVTLKEARHKVIHHLLSTSAYSKMISNLLYTGIKEYILGENIITKHVPGMSFMMKMGRKTVGNVMPSLEDAIDKKIIDYIESNIGEMIQNSEKFLDDFLTEKQIVNIGNEVWEAISKNMLSEYFSAINTNDMEDFINIGNNFWLHFRTTQYFKEIYKELVYYFFNKYGDKNLNVLLEDVGVSKEIMISEASEIISHGIETALANGYLAERIRARLVSFYSSEKATSL